MALGAGVAGAVWSVAGGVRAPGWRDAVGHAFSSIDPDSSPHRGMSPSATRADLVSSSIAASPIAVPSPPAAGRSPPVALPGFADWVLAASDEPGSGFAAYEPLRVGSAAPPSAGPVVVQDRAAGDAVGLASAEQAELAPGAPVVASTSSATIAVRRGDTLLTILGRAGVTTAEARDVVGVLRKVFDPRSLQVGQALALDTAAADDGTHLVGMSLGVDARSTIVLRRDEAGTLTGSTLERPVRKVLARARGTIDDSLYNAASGAEVPPSTLAAAIRLLSWDVDFQRDLQPGDRFEMLYERFVDDKDVAVGADEPLFVGLTLRDRTVAAYRFTGSDGRTAYYDDQGRALRKWLLKTPIDGARLSSSFGIRRHPILGYSRMHKGVDFAASTGTPIFAAGDGMVEVAGRNRGYGNYVRIRHNREYATAYGHLSRFARGLHAGERVRQGEVIGLVGATGLATGPHLHFEVLKDGTQINPMGVNTVTAGSLRGADLDRFLAAKAAIDRQRQDDGTLVAGDQG